MKRLFLLLALLPGLLAAQGYTSYFTGNATNIATTTEPGLCIMGGATEHDNAMIWLLQKANGGDVVVLRASGSNGYNNYLYSELGVNVNSVETLVITSAAAAVNPYVLEKVANAEMIWFAGGDQWNYVSYFKNNAMEELLNNHINVKQAPIGGTSAGMAIMGSHYFSAQQGSVTSATALNNPYASTVTIGANDFLENLQLKNTITDSHFDEPDRRGRMLSFLARIAADEGIRSFGIAANEYVAICIGADSKAYVYGDYPAYDEFAYFVQANCQEEFAPEICIAGSPLTWNRSGQAVHAYRVPGTMNGTNYFNLSDWQSGEGGIWQHWTAVNGSFVSTAGTAPDCDLDIDEAVTRQLKIFPVPMTDVLQIGNTDPARVQIYDVSGRIVLSADVRVGEVINVSALTSGIYSVIVDILGKKQIIKVIKD